MVACNIKPRACHAALVLQAHMHVHIHGTCVLYLYIHLSGLPSCTVLHSQYLAHLGVSHCDCLYLSHSCVCCSARRCVQSQHLHCPFAPTFTHSFTRTVLFCFVSTKQIPVQAHSLSCTCFLLQPHIYLSLLRALAAKSLIFSLFLTFTERSFSRDFPSSVSVLHTHAFSLLHIFSQTCIL